MHLFTYYKKIYNNLQVSFLFKSMVKTNSLNLELGTMLPNFELLNANSLKKEKFSSSDLDDRNLFIMFICAHCPFVKHIERQITELQIDIQETFQIIAISSNDINTHPADSPQNLRSQAEKNGWHFPYLYDEDQSFAKALKAACTPDFYIFSNIGESNFSLFYHGQLDDSRPSNNIAVTGRDLRSAVRAANNGLSYNMQQIPSLGCNIKWTPGKEPEWFN